MAILLQDLFIFPKQRIRLNRYEIRSLVNLLLKQLETTSFFQLLLFSFVSSCT